MNLIGYVDVSGGCIFEEFFWVVLVVANVIKIHRIPALLSIKTELQGTKFKK